MTNAPRAWFLALALVACSQKDEDKAKATASEAAEKAKSAAATAKDKASHALDRAREAAGAAKDTISEAIAAGEEKLDSLALRPGILDELDAGIKRATEDVKTAANDAARKAAMATLVAVTQARAAIAKRIDEMKAAGTYKPTAP